MGNVSDKGCRENQNKHFMFKKSPHPPKIVLAVCEIRRENIVDLDWPQMAK